jgi:formate dehydrogenase beta subunit
MPELPVAERIDSMVEVDQAISEAEAKYESGRCLNCCRVCYDLGNVDKNSQNAA